MRARERETGRRKKKKERMGEKERSKERFMNACSPRTKIKHCQTIP